MASSIASTVVISEVQPARALAQTVMLGLEAQAVRQRDFVELLLILVKTALTDFYIASTVVLLVESQGLATALRVTRVTAERVAKLQTRAQRLLILQRTVQTASFIV